MKTWTYYGNTIYRNSEPGYRLPYAAYVDGDFLAADTLAGIKRLIRERVRGNV